MKLKTLILHFLISVFFLHPSFCRGTEIPAHSTSTKIEQIFKQSDYDNYLLPPEYRYPPLFVSSWPQDFNDIKSPQQRHKFFLMILLPLALDINRSLSQERQVIIYLDHKRRTDSLDSSDKQIIEDLSAKYDFFTRLPPPLRYESQLKELLLRVDSIPPSIFLAAAAINTNWGEAKFLAPSNNLYRELLWYTDEGLKPQDETQDNSYRIKIIEMDRDKCLKLIKQVPDNCQIVNGDARDIDLLKDEGISDYDAFIALTDSSETNILACLTAKEFGVKKTIAEVENIQFIAQAENLNIGTVINKKLLASSKIFQILLDFDSSNSKCLALTDAEVAEIVAKEKSKITKAQVKDLHLSSDMTIGGLIRNGKGMLVKGDTLIQPGDHVLVFCLSGAIRKIEKMFN